MVMGRTSIDIDEAACRAVMKRYALATKRQAVNLALRTLAAEPFPVEAVGALRGSGWEEIAVHAIAAAGSSARRESEFRHTILSEREPAQQPNE